MASVASTVKETLPEFEFPSLSPDEKSIKDESEKLWRQVHPKNLEKGVVSNAAFDETAPVAPSAFVGTSEAKYEVSTSMASVVSAKEAYEHFIKSHQSAGSYVVEVKDVVDCFARAVDDSARYKESDDVKAHAYIDLRNMPKFLQKRVRSHLATKATENRRQHPPLGSA